MRSLQEEALATFYKKVRKGSVYNRKWWNPLPLSMYIHDLIRYEGISSMIEVGTGNGWSSVWGALGGAFVWTCDVVDRPKIWDDEDFPLPHLGDRIHYFDIDGDRLLQHQLTRTSNVCRDLIFLDGPYGEKGFRRQWQSLTPKTDDIIVTPMRHPEIYTCWQKIANAGFKVMFNSSTESFTLKWPNDGNLRDW